jgi:DNA-binding NarL/FixJ family response regulator
MIKLLIVEDNHNLRAALKSGLEALGQAAVVFDCPSGEEALSYCLNSFQNSENLKGFAILMDVQLEGKMNGIQSAVAIRREYPRLPVVFYSIQDDDAYYRNFRKSGILSHYAYVRKSNYLLPEMILPLLKDALSGRSFIDPQIEARVHEVRQKDQQAPMALLEPNEQVVARMLAEGLTNEQIAARMGYKDKRTISRVNGQIYTVWGLKDNPTSEKIARTRAALIVQSGRLLEWDQEGVPRTLDGEEFNSVQ